MKIRTLLFLGFLAFTSIGASAQTNRESNGMWSYEGKNGEVNVGIHGAVGLDFTTIDNRTAGLLGAKIGFLFNEKLSVGVMGKGIWYDYRLKELATTGTYHGEGGYTGVYVTYYVPLGEYFKIGLSLSSGQGIFQLKYDTKYTEELQWYETIIDQDDYAVLEPGIEVMIDFASRWNVAVTSSYRNTSPVQIDGMAENALNGLNVGVCVGFDLF
mgnify:CR=1 FL=1